MHGSPAAPSGTCARCDVKIDEVIPAKGHDYSYKSASSTEPTCTESGHYQGTCPRCYQDYNDTIPALGHDWGEWVTTIEPTVSTVGYRYHICNRDGCGYREGEDIPKLHTHTWDAGVVTQKPTAAEPGVRTYTCTVCGQTRTEAIPATGVPETCNGGPACPATPSAICPRRASGRTRGWITASIMAILPARRQRPSRRTANARAP